MGITAQRTRQPETGNKWWVIWVYSNTKVLLRDWERNDFNGLESEAPELESMLQTPFFWIEDVYCHSIFNSRCDCAQSLKIQIDKALIFMRALISNRLDYWKKQLVHYLQRLPRQAMTPLKIRVLALQKGKHSSLIPIFINFRHEVLGSKLQA